MRRSNEEPTADLSVVDSLARLSFGVMALIERVATAHELSMVQVRLLGILRDREPAMMDLANVLGLDKSSVTGLVSRAEARGFVQRNGRQDDRRAVVVSLTPAGRKLATTLEKQMDREMEAFVAVLAPRERRQIAALAMKILGDGPKPG